MVWGLVSPTGLGKYFPDVDYVGEDARYEHYLRSNNLADEGALDVQIRDARYAASRKFKYDEGPLQPHEQPDWFRSKKTLSELSSMIELVDQLVAVDGRLKTIIEGFEPGIHQFWPIRLQMPKDDYPTQYFGLVIRQFRNSLRPDLSAVRGSSTGSYFANGKDKKGYAELTVSASAIGGAHLWREKELARPNILISDELQHAIAAQSLLMPKHYKLGVV